MAAEEDYHCRRQREPQRPQVTGGRRAVAELLPTDQIQELVNNLLAKAVTVTEAIDAVTTAHDAAVKRRDYAAAAEYREAGKNLQRTREQLIFCADELVRVTTR